MLNIDISKEVIDLFYMPIHETADYLAIDTNKLYFTVVGISESIRAQLGVTPENAMEKLTGQCDQVNFYHVWSLLPQFLGYPIHAKYGLITTVDRNQVDQVNPYSQGFICEHHVLVFSILDERDQEVFVGLDLTAEQFGNSEPVIIFGQSLEKTIRKFNQSYPQVKTDFRINPEIW